MGTPSALLRQSIVLPNRDHKPFHTAEAVTTSYRRGEMKIPDGQGGHFDLLRDLGRDGLMSEDSPTGTYWTRQELFVALCDGRRAATVGRKVADSPRGTHRMRQDFSNSLYDGRQAAS